MPTPNLAPRIPAIVTIAEILSARHYRAALPNGKLIIAHYPTHRPGAQLSIGDTVPVELDLTDFSEGEITSPETGLTQGMSKSL